MITYARFNARGYECSTKGDSRYSAFNAMLSDGRTIEMHYQCDIKGYDFGGTKWKLGKGKPSLIVYEDIYIEYRKLWIEWACLYPNLIEELYVNVGNDGVLTDMFATSEVNQARALADILNHVYNGLQI